MSSPVTQRELESVAKLVRQHFGYSDVRPGQAEVLARVLRGESVLAVLPTGGGKSITYQLPGLLSDGVTLVVSPLIALMKDQLDNLPPAMRAASVAVTSELDPGRLRQVIDDIADGRYRLVYAAPERLRQLAFREALRRAGVARLVVDEAHCVSMWGHDFRPDYLNLAEARRALADPPVLAVTATAPPTLRRDVQERLGPMTEVVVPIHRPNLRFDAIRAADADENLAHLVHLVKESEGSVLVYAASRAKCETISGALQGHGIRADYYHAGLGDLGGGERAKRQDLFVRGRTRVLVATTAFGMGIDKDDIRLLVHVDPPTSLEAYFQEAGRAGRDGAPARCVLLTSAHDASTSLQRVRRDLPDDDLVEQVRLLVGACRVRDDLALVPQAELDRLHRDASPTRTALGLLEGAGVVERLGEAPRVVEVQGSTLGFDGEAVSLFDAADALDVAPADVENALFQRALAGELRFGTGPRDLLLRVTGRDGDVPAALARFRAKAEERARAVLDYAAADACRHAIIAKHFGDPTPEDCKACDHCLGIEHHLPDDARPDDDQDALAVLLALSNLKGIGATNLAHLLRGDPMAPPWTDTNPARGKLGARSASKIKGLVQRLEARGLVDTETLSHGGKTYRITASGRAALGMERVDLVDAKRLRQAQRKAVGRVVDVKGVRKPRAKERKATPADDGPADPDLLGRLKAWRANVARAQGVPAYVVAHDRTLLAVARAQPKTPKELLAVHGFGPKKVTRYGAAILEVVAGKEPPPEEGDP